MTLQRGKEFLMIPGPTNIPDEVLRAMHRRRWISMTALWSKPLKPVWPD